MYPGIFFFLGDGLPLGAEPIRWSGITFPEIGLILRAIVLTCKSISGLEALGLMFFICGVGWITAILGLLNLGICL